MTRSSVLLVAGLALAPVVAATANADSEAVAYVQATIMAADPAAGSIGFMTASGRSRTARATGSALVSLRNLQPGDEVILTLEGPADRPVATSVKVSRVEPPPPAPGTLTSPYAWTQTVPSRPSWPNPYSRINPGLPGRPARAPQSRAGTLSVMPVAMTTSAAPPARPAVLAPAPAAAPPAAREQGTVENLRARGARDFEAAVTRLAAEARSVDSAYALFKASCSAAKTADGDASREWFGLLDGAAVADSCAPLLDEMRRLGAPIRAGMLAAQESARSAWVLPGTMTEIRRRHAMEWSGWEH